MITATDILNAIAAWESTEFGVLTPPLRAFATYPTASDVDGQILYPYTCHQIESSTSEALSINHMNSVEDTETHKIWHFYIYGDMTMPMDRVSAKDAYWRSLARAGFLKHLLLNFGSGIAENTMGPITPCSFKLLGRQEQGIKFPSTVTVRQGMPTGN